MTSESYPLTKEKNATMMGMNNDSNKKSLIITTAFVVFYFIICLEDLHDFFFLLEIVTCTGCIMLQRFQREFLSKFFCIGSSDAYHMGSIGLTRCHRVRDDS